MPATPNQPQDIQSVTLVALLVGSLCVIYWRTMLRLLVMALITLAICGIIIGFYEFHYIVR